MNPNDHFRIFRSKEPDIMLRKLLHFIVFSGIGMTVFMVFSVLLQRELPAPTGPFTVGRDSQIWVDEIRHESLSEQPDDSRQLPVEVWYPAETGTGTRAAYFPDLKHLASSLAASGEVSALEVAALRLLKPESHEMIQASLSGSEKAYPVIVLSPGNGTNVEFYTLIAEELASHGYVVVGLNHPYDVAAVALQGGDIAQFAPGPFPLPEHEAWVGQRMVVRTEDILFALGQLEKLNADDGSIFFGRLDLAHVAVMGHSLGGVGATQACLASLQFRACLNLDGIQRGGPFSTSENPASPEQPFMMITKEKELPSASKALFEAIPSGSYRLVIDGADHESFTDGVVMRPSLLPLPDRADRILDLVRRYTLAFFDQTLKGKASPLLAESGQAGQARLEVYPPH